MYDIMERKITIVEQLFKPRQPFPDLDVIYLVSSKTESFKRIVADFSTPSKVNYKSVHIFTLDAVSAYLHSLEPSYLSYLHLLP
jgi:syntaxin-binding protein 1